MSLSLSSLSPGPTPSSVGCLPNSAPTLRNVSGLAGHVCQVNFAPEVMDISSCCKEGMEVRVQDDCTQYCETNDDQSRKFRDCVVDKLDQDPVTAIAAYCQVINETSPSSAPGASQTPSPSATNSGDLPESTGQASSLAQYSVALTAIAVVICSVFSTV